MDPRSADGPGSSLSPVSNAGNDSTSLSGASPSQVLASSSYDLYIPPHHTRMLRRPGARQWHHVSTMCACRAQRQHARALPPTLPWPRRARCCIGAATKECVVPQRSKLFAPDPQSGPERTSAQSRLRKRTASHAMPRQRASLRGRLQYVSSVFSML